MPKWSSDYRDYNSKESEYSTEEEDCDYKTNKDYSDLLYRSDPYFQESEIVLDLLIDTQTDPTDLTTLIAEDL
jgi:hypothetical protein